MFPAITELTGVKLQLKGMGRGVHLQKAEQKDERRHSKIGYTHSVLPPLFRTGMELRCSGDELEVETRRLTLPSNTYKIKIASINQPLLKGMMALYDPRPLHLLARTFLLHYTSEVENMMLFCNCSIISQEFTNGVALQGIDPATPHTEIIPRTVTPF
jgi:hypothetical protein